MLLFSIGLDPANFIQDFKENQKIIDSIQNTSLKKINLNNFNTQEIDKKVNLEVPALSFFFSDKISQDNRKKLEDKDYVKKKIKA